MFTRQGTVCDTTHNMIGRELPEEPVIGKNPDECHFYSQYDWSEITEETVVGKSPG